MSLAPSCTETLVELGLADRLVGVSDYCPELPAADRAAPVARVGGLMNPNVEVLLQLKPDLVLTVQNAEDRSLATLRRAGVAVRASDPQSLEAMLAEVQALGDLFDAGDKARALVTSLRARLDAVRAKGPAGAARPRLYVEVDHPGCWTIGRRSFVRDAVDAAGAVNLFDDVDRAYAEVSKEEIVTRQPDWILVLHPVDRPLSERAELARLPALREGRVITDFEKDDLLHSSPRLVRGIERLAERLARR